MTLENAILTLAAAMEKVAESNHALAAAGTNQAIAIAETAVAELRSVTGSAQSHDVAAAVSAPAAAKDADLEKAAAKVEQEAKAEAAKHATAKEAVQAALAAAKAEEKPAEAVTLTYAADIAPRLIELGKKNRDALVELLREFGAKNGPGLKDSDYPAVLAKANALLAG